MPGAKKHDFIIKSFAVVKKHHWLKLPPDKDDIIRSVSRWLTPDARSSVDRNHGTPESIPLRPSAFLTADAPSLQLFAWRLTFIHPTSGRKMEFKLSDERAPF